MKRTCDFRLRKGGFAFLPLDADAVFVALKASVDTGYGRFAENRDLIAIRGNLQRIRSMKILRLPDEVGWFSHMAHASKNLLAQIWNDGAIQPVMAEKMSDWVLDVLCPLPTAWQESIVLAKEEDTERPTKFVLIQLISIGLTLTDTVRKEAYAKWTNKRLVKPLLQANVLMVDEVSQFIGSLIAKSAREIADELA
jgi:hypothetical protein